jgi:UDP-GlcNAc3NAcA epimerase
VLRARSGVEELLVHTGQHYDDNMSKVFFDELEIPAPDANLGIGSGGHGAQTARMLEALERLLLEQMPDIVLVYGDTNSTLAAALAAVKLHLPVAHVEAGLRSFNRRMPEEINRIVADQCSDLLLAPTATAVEHLRNEGIGESRVRLVGDVMYDAALFYAAKAQRSNPIMANLGLRSRGYVLCTVHRAENTDDPARLEAIFRGLEAVARRTPVIVPLHPRTRAALGRAGLAQRGCEDLRVIDPVGYLDMVVLEKHARMIVTDSGGVQKEAYFHAVPCATLREETEWTELVEAGWNTLIAPRNGASIADSLLGLLDTPHVDRARPEFYGNGQAAERIADELLALCDGRRT